MPTAISCSRPNDAHIASLLPMVNRIARKVRRRLPPSVPLDDLVGAGMLGLVEAAQRYDVRLNDNFAAYAEIRVRGAIMDEIRSMDWLPRSVRRRARLVEQAKRALTIELGRPPERDELALHLELDDEGMAALERELRVVVLVQNDELDSTIGNHLPGPSARLLHEERVRQLAAAIDQLPEKERQVVALYYLENLKLREIGKLLGVTESRICQIHTRAIMRLREQLVLQQERAAA